MSPHVIDLVTAINEIKSAYDEHILTRAPFFFIVGAGISYPSIPLASEITAHCRTKAESRGFKIERSRDESSLSEYSFWFDKAYPQPIDRQRYLRSLIEKKPITDANLRLAHILLARTVTNLVITPNFDDLLSRSLNIFGEQHVVSDHPRTVDRIDLEGEDLQIVHVHGSYRFYDCRNLRDELETRARPSLTTTNTMAAFLDRALSFRSPIVVGYAGWESDVIMAALRRRLEGNTLPYRLYWCCYREHLVQELPDWLIDHGDVRIVIAPALAPTIVPLASSGKKEESTTDQNEIKRLPAHTVFEALSRAFELQPPALTSDPLGFFLKQLRHSINSDVGTRDAVYFLGDIVSQVEKAAELLRNHQQAPIPSKAKRGSSNASTAKMIALKDAVRKSRYDEALEIALMLNPSKMPKRLLSEWFDIMSACLRRGSGEPAKELKAANQLITAGKKLSSSDEAGSFIKYTLSPTLEKAEILRSLDQEEQAIQLYDQLIAKMSGKNADQLISNKLYVQTRKAMTLHAVGKTQEAIALYEKLLPDLGGPHRSDFLLAQSLYNRSSYLTSLNRSPEAVNAIDEFIREYGEAKDGWTQVLIAAALTNKASILTKAGNPREAATSLQHIIELYTGVEHPQVKQQVERAREFLASLKLEQGPEPTSPPERVN